MGLQTPTSLHQISAPVSSSSSDPIGSLLDVSLGTIHNPALRQGLRQALTGNYEKALATLSRAGGNSVVINAKGVCLLRLARFPEAVRVYRGLLLAPNCTWMRPEMPTVYKTNFATALLLGVSAGGCLEVLNEIADQQHPTILRLRAAIRQWEDGLTLWQKFNWRCGRLEPRNRPVQIDFPPGEFGLNR